MRGDGHYDSLRASLARGLWPSVGNRAFWRRQGRRPGAGRHTLEYSRHGSRRLEHRLRGRWPRLPDQQTWSKNPLNTVTINHITAFPNPTNMIIVGNPMKDPRMYKLVFTNSLMTTAKFPVWNTGSRNSCARKDEPISTFNTCFTSYTFTNNGLIAPPPNYPPSVWPAHNMFPKNVNDVQFVDYNNGNGGNYQL